MIPVSASDIGNIEFDDAEEVIQPSLIFKIDFDNGVFSGLTDGVEALKQAIICRLMTERKQFSIFSETYGLPLNELLGQSSPLVYVSVANAITDTLLEDDRITSVSGFIFDADSKSICVSFNVESIFGTMDFKEVSL